MGGFGSTALTASGVWVRRTSNVERGRGLGLGVKESVDLGEGEGGAGGAEGGNVMYGLVPTMPQSSKGWTRRKALAYTSARLFSTRRLPFLPDFPRNQIG